MIVVKIIAVAFAFWITVATGLGFYALWLTIKTMRDDK